MAGVQLQLLLRKVLHHLGAAAAACLLRLLLLSVCLCVDAACAFVCLP